MYVFLDWLILVFHTSLMFFVLIGWGWRRTRRWHLFVLTLILLSWYGLGIFYGFGYCLCTDWHWQVKEALGETDLPDSYVKYFLDRLTGRGWDARLVNASVVLITLTVFALSLWLNWRDWRARI